jgi:hypothetical protein
MPFTTAQRHCRTRRAEEMRRVSEPNERGDLFARARLLLRAAIDPFQRHQRIGTCYHWCR